MPRTLPAGTEAFLAKQGGMFVPIVLLDIQTLDGMQYFWSDYEGTYPAKIAAGNQFYNGWIKSGCNFTRTRAFRSGPVGRRRRRADRDVHLAFQERAMRIDRSSFLLPKAPGRLPGRFACRAGAFQRDPDDGAEFYLCPAHIHWPWNTRRW